MGQNIYIYIYKSSRKSREPQEYQREKILVLLEPSRPGPGHVGPETAVLAGRSIFLVIPWQERSCHSQRISLDVHQSSRTATTTGHTPLREITRSHHAVRHSVAISHPGFDGQRAILFPPFSLNPIHFPLSFLIFFFFPSIFRSSFDRINRLPVIRLF